MKFAVLNDTHAGVRNDSIHFHEYMRKFYEEVFFPYLLEMISNILSTWVITLIKELVLTFFHYKETKNTLSTI